MHFFLNNPKVLYKYKWGTAWQCWCPRRFLSCCTTCSLAGTLPGMAAFKRLINIQIYSSHFNLNSMHIIR